MSGSAESPSVTTRGPEGETYPEFTARVAADQARVDAKLAALDKFIPCCTACGETCNPVDAGRTCRQNGMSLVSQWARQVAQREFYRLGHFGGSWHNEVNRLAVLLDRVRAGVEDTTEGRRPTTERR
ncbi:MAG: hypothetical protein V4537_14605 [Pseudomonadota bacterium]